MSTRHRELDHLGALFSNILTNGAGYSETVPVKTGEEGGSGEEAGEAATEEGVEAPEEISEKLWEEIQSMPQVLMTGLLSLTDLVKPGAHPISYDLNNSFICVLCENNFTAPPRSNG